MQQTGLNSDLHVGKKRLHIQTSFSNTTSTIISNIFENGRVVEARKVDLPKEQINGQLDSRLKTVHRQMVEDFELLFYMADKVRQVRHPVSCNKMGLVFIKKGFLEEAIAFFKLAISTDDGFADAYKNLGVCYLMQEDYEQAEHAFRQALGFAKDFADIVFCLGRLYFEKKEYATALEFFEKCTSLNKSYYTAHYFISLTLLRTLQASNKPAELPPEESCVKLIQKHLDDASKAHKPFVNNLSMQARSALAAGNYKEASDYLEKAYEQAQAELDLTFEHEFYLKFMYGGKGKDNAFIGNYIDALNDAIDERPEFADLHNN
ncbi:MAG: tetratricopeptide repeat protein, partial [bacterium]